MVTNAPSESRDILNKISYENAFFVGDSLMSGIASGKANISFENGRITANMLKDINTQKNKEKITRSQVVFFLGGTNDVVNNAISAKKIIENIKSIATTVRENGAIFIPGTIPPIPKYSNNTKINEKIDTVNFFIRTEYADTFIDYNQILRNPNNTTQLRDDIKTDNIHPSSAYGEMRQLQQEKIQAIAENKDSAGENNDTLLIDVQQSIIELNKMIQSLNENTEAVFGGDITPKQKQEAEKINRNKKDLLLRFERLLKDFQTLEKQTKETQGKIDITNTKDQEYKNLTIEMEELNQTLDDLKEQKTILEKEFRGLNDGNLINPKLAPNQLTEMESIGAIEFLQKPFEERLQYVTVNNIPFKSVQDGIIKNLEINFSFDGKFNKQVYMKTTAGMILPNEVREVESGGVIYKRNPNALKGEFFTDQGKRLVIRDTTKISVTKLVTQDKLNKQYQSKIDVSKYEKNPLEKDIVLEAEKRGIPTQIALEYCIGEIKDIQNQKEQLAQIEDLLVDIDRRKGAYFVNTKKNAMENGKYSLDFIAYLAVGDAKVYGLMAESVGYQKEEIEDYRQFPQQSLSTMDVSKIKINNIAPEEIERIRHKKKFIPNSKDTTTLFRIATHIAKLPEEWAGNPNLHRLMKKESAGDVGSLNYTIKDLTIDDYRKIMLNAEYEDKINPKYNKKGELVKHRINQQINASSTASGLGQLTMDNIDNFYPSGRRGIGDPIEEAVGFVKYIYDRYGDPNTAMRMWGKLGEYTNTRTRKKQNKGHAGGY